MFTLYDIRELAIRLEENGEKVYRKAIRHTDNATLKNVLEWIAEEEVKHAQWFSKLKGGGELGEDHELLSEMSNSLIDQFVSDQSFSLKEVDFTQIKTIDEMIAIFIEFENDTILFYELLQSFITDDETSKALDRIIEEEKHHIERFKEIQNA